MRIDYRNQGAPSGYDGYPSSYQDDVFPTDGLGSLGSVPDGYVGFATVATTDPPPSGDLKVHVSPDASSTQIGAADKDSVLAVRGDQSTVPGWALVQTSGGGRNAQVTGYVSTAYLAPVVQPSQPAPAPLPPPAPNTPPNVTPGTDVDVTVDTGLSTGVVVAIAAGAVVVGGAIYYLLGRKKRSTAARIGAARRRAA